MACSDVGALLRRWYVSFRLSQPLFFPSSSTLSTVDAIIFLVPISGFDQVLSEDRTVNRLEDSVLLWKSVCSNKLLSNVDLVLFLNKCDILDAKLKSGTRLAKYVRSYGDRENDLDTVSNCRFYLSPLSDDLELM